jgi:FimV-like protein
MSLDDTIKIMLSARKFVRTFAKQHHAAAQMRQFLMAILLCPFLTWASMPVDGLILVQRPDQTLHGRLNFQDKSQARDAIVRLASAREYQRFGLVLPDFAPDAMVQEDAKLPGVLFISTAQAVRSREFDLVFKTALSTGVAFTRFHAKVGADNSITLTRSVLAVDKVSDAGDSGSASEAAQRQGRKSKNSAVSERNETPAPKLTSRKDEVSASTESKAGSKSQVAENRKAELAAAKPKKSSAQQDTPIKTSAPASAPTTDPATVVANVPGPAVVSAPLLTAAMPAQATVPTPVTPHVVMAPPPTPQPRQTESASLSDSVSLQINKLDLILWLAGISMVLSVGGMFWTAFSRKNDEIQRLKDGQAPVLINPLPSAHESGQAALHPAQLDNADKKKSGPLYESETESVMVQAIAQKYGAIAAAQIRANYYQTLVSVGQDDARDDLGQATRLGSQQLRMPQTNPPATQSAQAASAGLNASGISDKLPKSSTQAVDALRQPNGASPAEPEVRTTVSGPAVTTGELAGVAEKNIPVRRIMAPALQVPAPNQADTTQAAPQPRPAEPVRPKKSAESEKLNLAVVYLNMGDLPTATILAKEVAAAANPEVAQEARELLKSIEVMNEK